VDLLKSQKPDEAGRVIKVDIDQKQVFPKG